MNIRRMIGTSIHYQQKDNKTLCGLFLKRIVYNRERKVYEEFPFFEATEEAVSCPECRVLHKRKKDEKEKSK